MRGFGTMSMNEEPFFVPRAEKDGPDLGDLDDARITLMTFQDDSRDVLRDKWRSEGQGAPPGRLQDALWVGERGSS